MNEKEIWGSKDRQKTLVLDTTVLIDNPAIISSLTSKENKVVIPLAVIGQLDGLKNNENKEKAEKARKASRAILEAQGRKEIEVVNNFKKGADVLNSSADNKIIGTCLRLKEQGENVIVLTTDVNMEITAKSMGIEAIDSLLTPSKKAALQEFEKLKNKLYIILFIIICTTVLLIGGNMIPAVHELLGREMSYTLFCIGFAGIPVVFIFGFIIQPIILYRYIKKHGISKEIASIVRDDESFRCRHHFDDDDWATNPCDLRYVGPLRDDHELWQK